MHVIGVEPDTEAFAFGCENGFLNPVDDCCCTLQELPSKLNGMFDWVTIFLFSVSTGCRYAVFERISKLLKPDGKLLIGTECKDYTLLPEHDQFNSSLRPL